MGPYFVYIVSGAAVAGIFVLFLVLSRTLNTIVNHLTRIQYYLEREFEVKKEYEEIRRMLAGQEQTGAAKEDEEEA